MMRIQLSPSRLAGARFTISPMLQLVPALVAVRRGRSVPGWISDGWARLSPRSRARLGHFVHADARTVPDFLMPYPTSARSDVDTELNAVRAASADVVRYQLSTVVSVGRVPERFARARGVSVATAESWRAPATSDDVAAYEGEPERVTHPVADALAEAWRLMLEPRWRLVRSILDADVLHRGSVAAAEGMESAVCDLFDVSERSGDSADVATTLKVDAGSLDGELVLAPSVFLGEHLPYGFVMGPRLGDVMLGYPSRGRAAVLGMTKESAPSEGLWALLPASRRAVLQSLDVPRSGRSIATLLGLSPATVSHHLDRLRRDGLVEGTRVGKQVIYRTTEQVRRLSAR